MLDSIKFVIIIGGILLGNYAFAQDKSYKRGVSYEIPYEEDFTSLSKGVSWFYNWGGQPKDHINTCLLEAGVDFVPMAWNGGYNENALRSYLQTHPNVKYILGFNEPNFKSQANMTPAEAVAAWPRLQKIADDFDLKIVSPAVNFSADAPYQDPNTWLDEFFRLLPSDARVDYVAVHCYMPYPSALMWYIGKFKKYGRPIWLTEFCAWDNFWEIPGDQPSNQMRYMVDAINYLESDPDVYRYAWFIPRTAESNKYPYMQLLEDNAPGVLTALGKVFVSMSSQDKFHYFQIDEKIPAEHYTSMNIVDVKNSDDWKGSIMLRPTTDMDGELEIYDFNDNKWVEYNIDVSQTANYSFCFRYATSVGAECKFFLDGVEKKVLSFASTLADENWTESVFSGVELEAGKHTVRLQVVNGNLCLNWWYLSTSTVSLYNNFKNEKFLVYPSVVTDILYINDLEDINRISIYSQYGQQMNCKINGNEVDCSSFPCGCYVIEILKKNGDSSFYKIIKK